MPRKKKIPGVDPAYLQKQKTMLLRRNRHVLYFNDSEMAAIDEYCSRFQVRHRSALLRDAIMFRILEVLDQNPSSLF